MHRVDRRIARFDVTRPSRRRIVALAAAITPLLPVVASAQTWINPNTGLWSVSGNWVSGAVPVSAPATQLLFNAGGAESYTASNDIANPFALNSLTLNNSGTGLITIDQNALSFSGASPAINQSGSGNARLNNALQLTTNTTLSGTGTGTVTLAGAITSVPAATGTSGSSLINSNNNASLVLLGGTTGGNLYGLRLSSGNTFIQSGAYTLTSTQRGSDPFESINDGGFWSFIVGNTAGQTAHFTMTGGSMTGQNAMVGNVVGGSGIATFSGATTTATFTGAQGRFGTNFGDGTINVLNGAVVSARRLDMIRNSAGGGTTSAFVQVSGAASRLSATQEFNLPLSSGNATLSVSSGGLVEMTNANFFVAAAISPSFDPVSSNARVDVTGANSRINLGTLSAINSMVVGFGDIAVPANGTVSISDGGIVDAPGTFIGRLSGTGTVTVSGSASRLNNRFEVVVGSNTASSLNVTDSARWTNTGDSFTSTASTDRAVINVSGTNSLADLTGLLVLSGGGSSTLNISSGGELRAANVFASDDASSTSNTFVSGANSKFTIKDQGFISDAANATANITVSGGGNMNVSSVLFMSSPIDAISNVTITGTGSTYTSTLASTQLQIGGNGGVAGGTATFGVNDGATATVSGPTVVYTRGNLNVGSGALPGSFTGSSVSVNGTVNFNAGTFNTTGSLSVAGQVLLSSAARDGAGTPSNKKVLEAGLLSLTASGVVDLNDNDAILHSTPLLTAQNEIRDARNGGLWNAPGITSTAAKNAVPKNTSLGAISGANFHAGNGGAGALFNGRTVAASDTLIKYTYYGDTDLNGVVNFDDYARTDGGFNNNRTGWFNGDFDYNGIVNFDDYSLIDLAFNSQGAVVLSTGAGELAGPGGREIISVAMPHDLAVGSVIAPTPFDPAVLRGNSLQAVPEPTSLGAASLSLFAAAMRRRRRRSFR